MYVCIYTYIYIYIYISHNNVPSQMTWVVHIHVCMYVFMYVCDLGSAHSCMYVCMYVSDLDSAHSCMYVCMYVSWVGAHSCIFVVMHIVVTLSLEYLFCSSRSESRLLAYHQCMHVQNSKNLIVFLSI